MNSQHPSHWQEKESTLASIPKNALSAHENINVYASAPLFEKVMELLQDIPSERDKEKIGQAFASFASQEQQPLPSITPYISALCDMFLSLQQTRKAHPEGVQAFCQRRLRSLQLLLHTTQSVEEEIKWLDKQHPFLPNLQAFQENLLQQQKQAEEILSSTLGVRQTPAPEIPQNPEASALEKQPEEISPPPAASPPTTTPPAVARPAPVQPAVPALSPEELNAKLQALRNALKGGEREHTAEKAAESSALNKTLKTNGNGKKKDIPAMIERIKGRIQDVADSSSFRSAINEVEQAHRVLEIEDWEELCASLCLQAQKASIEPEEWDRFPQSKQFLQNRGISSQTLTHLQRQNQSPNEGEDADIKVRRRFREFLDDEQFALYRSIVENVCAEPLQYLPLRPEEERHILLSIWSAQTRFIQEFIPEEEIFLQSFLRTLFGRINSARKEYVTQWVEPLNRRFETDWMEYIREQEGRLAALRGEQEAELQRRTEEEERAWEREQRVFRWLNQLREMLMKMPESVEADSAEATALLQLLREMLEDEMNPSDDELLHMIEPYEELLQHGSEFRHLRRHLRKHKEQAPEEREAAAIEKDRLNKEVEQYASEDTNETSAYSQQLQKRREAQKLRRVLPLVQGRHAVIMGGDEREQARERLQSMLGLKSLEWISREGGNPRSLDRLEERIASGKVTLVIVLLRFCGHDVGRIINACKKADALWVPIKHGYGESRVLHSLSYYLLEQDNPAFDAYEIP